VETDENTQTSGRLKRVAPYLGDEDFCFTYGDGVANVNIRELVKLNCSKKVKANLTCVQPPRAVRLSDIG
jgi:glucose-1-phosphate cytidylyltransferase